MALDIGELRGTISLQDQFSGPIQRVAAGLGMSGQSFRAVTQFAGLAVGAIGAATAAIVTLGTRGGVVAGVKDSFDALAVAAGTTGEALLSRMRPATQGLITDFDLMTSANRAMLLGLDVTPDSMATMAQAAVVLGRAMKQSAQKSFEDLITALGRGSPLILDNLGITVRQSEAQAEYARKLGVSVSELNESQRQTAFFTAAMEAARKKTGEIGEIQLTFADRMQQGRVAVSNFTDALGLAIAKSPVIAAGWDTMAAALSRAFGGQSQGMVQQLMGLVNQFAIFLVDVAEVGVEAARALGNAWQGFKLLFQGLMLGMAEGMVRVTGGLASMLEAAARLSPGFVPGAEAAAAALRGMATEATGFRDAYVGQVNETLDAAGQMNAGFDATQAVLTEVRTAMVNATGAQDIMVASSDTLKKKTDEVTTAVGLSKEQMKAMEDQTRRSEQAMNEAADQMAETFRTLQEELTVANLEGVQARLAEIEIARQREIEGLQSIAFMYPETYDEITQMVQDKYAQMAAAAEAADEQITLSAAERSLQERDRLVQDLDAAQQYYAQLVASGTASHRQLQAAHQAAKEAEEALNERVALSAVEQFNIIASSVSGILRTVFGRNKSAAIAAAIIDAAAAFVKALASAPPPLNFIAAAAVAAAAAAQIATIRRQDVGFRSGTPGTAFQDFGRETTVNLHGREAVITEAQGKSLAAQVGSEIRKARMGSGGGGGPVSITVPLNIDGQQLGKVVVEKTRRGQWQVHQAGVTRRT